MTARKGPTGFLGLTWGDDPVECARRLGLTLNTWNPWVDPKFETSMDLTARPVLGADGSVALVRADKRLVGVQVYYDDCARNEARKQLLRDNVRREFHLDVGDGLPYEKWSDGSLVHLVTRRDGACILTVAGPALGKPYADHELQQGLGDLGTKLTPH